MRFNEGGSLSSLVKELVIENYGNKQHLVMCGKLDNNITVIK